MRINRFVSVTPLHNYIVFFSGRPCPNAVCHPPGGKTHPHHNTMDGLSDVGVEVVNPGSKEGAVDTKIKAMLLKIIHNESHRPGPSDQIEIIVLLSADRDYSPEIQALRRFNRFRVLTFHSGNSKDYMMDETMIDAVSTRWDTIVTAATEPPAGDVKQGYSTTSTNLQQSPALLMPRSSSAPSPAESTAQLPRASPTVAVDVTSAPKTNSPTLREGQKEKDAVAFMPRNSCAVITNTSDQDHRIQKRIQRFEQGGGQTTSDSSINASSDHLVSQMAKMNVQSPPVESLLYCVQCRKDFTWTIAEQIAFRQRGLNHEPRLCHPCRAAPAPKWN